MHQSQGTSATHSLPERERVCDQVYIRLNGCQVMVYCLNYVGGRPTFCGFLSGFYQVKCWPRIMISLCAFIKQRNLIVIELFIISDHLTTGDSVLVSSALWELEGLDQH